jgi:hypothetical protein
MADDGKKKMTVEVKIGPKDLGDIDLKGASKSALESLPRLKTFKYKLEVEVDPKKWKQKKLDDKVQGYLRGCAIRLDYRTEKAKGDQKKVQSAWDEFLDEAEQVLDECKKDIESGKADNAGAIKAGKAAMAQLDAIKSNSYEDPRKGAIEALKPLTRDGADAKAVEKAKKALTTIKASFDRSGKAAKEAVTFLMQQAKKMKDDKDADAALKQFGAEVLKNEKVFQEFLDGAGKFEEAFGEALEATEEESVEANKAKELTKEFEALSSVEKKAQEAIKFAKQLQPKFKKIADKFK